MIVEEKKQFKYSAEPITVQLKLQPDSKGGWREDPDKQDIKQPCEETITYIRPSWGLANYLEGRATFAAPFDLMKYRIDATVYTQLQLMYYLKSCSMIELKLIKDEQGFEKIENMNDLVGPEGLHPTIINIIVEKIRG